MVQVIRVMIILCCFGGGLFPLKAEATVGQDNPATDRQAYQPLKEAQYREAFLQYLCRRLAKRKSDIAVSEFKVIGKGGARENVDTQEGVEFHKGISTVAAFRRAIGRKVLRDGSKGGSGPWKDSCLLGRGSCQRKGIFSSRHRWGRDRH